MCIQKQMNAGAARFFATAFATDAKLAENVQAGHRYDGACFAALAAAGKGVDAGKLSEEDRPRLREQAFKWLQDDLAARSKSMKDMPMRAFLVAQEMQRWRADPRLAGLRDEKELAMLPSKERDNLKEFGAKSIARPRPLIAKTCASDPTSPMPITSLVFY